MEGGPAEGGSRVGWSGAGPSRESEPTTTTTTITTPTPPEMEGRGQTQNKCGPKGVGRRARGPKGGPKGSGPLSPGLGWVWRVWGPGQNVGLWVFGVSAFWVENLAKTLKH